MKRLPFFFAKRYLLSPKSHSVINIISKVSAFAVGVPVAAMVVLLSVFNGFEGLIKRMYNDFDPDIAVSAVEGKTFGISEIGRERLLSVDGVVQVSYILEDNALLEYRGKQYLGTVRGVDSMYSRVVPIEGMVSGGKYELMFGDMMQALVGEGMASRLQIHSNLYDPIRAYVPRRGSYNPILPGDNYRMEKIFPAGYFALEEETDSKYLIAPIEFARSLFDYPDGVSSVMIRVAPGADPDRVRDAVAREVGDRFRVLTRYQQKASLYTIMTYEKWGIFLIILLVLVIAAFSIVGSLAMLIIDKRDDIRTIVSMGGGTGFVRAVFVQEGMMISTIGAASGMVLGLVLCWLQSSFGLIRIPSETFLVDTYPVVVQLTDMVWVAAAFIAVNYIFTKFTVIKMVPKSEFRI